MNFKHGGDVKGFAKEINCDVSEVVDLSSNINFIKPDIGIDFNDIDISSYPTYDELYNNIANLYGIENSELELFNGASSAIFSLFRFFNTRLCYIYSPAYLEYKKAASTFDYQVELINRFVDLDKEILPNSLVVFVNPSTPDGSFYDIDTLLSKWMEKNCTILIDESFIEFTIQKSCLEYINKYDKLYILKSLTKFYSCAGVRIGSVVSSSSNIKNIKKYEPMWKISELDMAYVNEVIKDTKFPQISKAINITNKEYLVKILKEFKYTNHIFDSSANFVLVQLKTITASQFQELLKPYKIMIRDCSNFDFLDEEFVRIAVKSSKNIDKLKKALNSICI
ncbi:aminotransferase class I/II-fold pyridoxal phosphate-dependent enzyme [Arcobacteraceae bacterium]|nr:aminotransferase class I/II-fold pyridoxal phosphate-dependent enzyme [Arcobacteraceae bacterium]